MVATNAEPMMAMIAHIFLYVGVETIALATATGYAKALELPGDNYGFIPSIGFGEFAEIRHCERP